MEPGKIVKGNTSKTLIKNFSALAILQIMRYMIPLVVLPYVTPIIGLEHWGELAIAGGLMMIVQLIVNYSFAFMGARDIARYRDDKKKVSEIVSTTLFAYLLLYLLMLLLSTIVIIAVPKFRAIWPVIAITLGTPIFSAFVCEWFFQGMEQMQNITIVNVLSRVVFLLLVFLFIKEKEDFLLYPLFSTIGFSFGAIYSIVTIVRKYKCKIVIPSFVEILSYIKQGKDIFFNQVCVEMFHRIPHVLLGVISGSASAGLYYAAARLQDSGFHAVGVLNRVFFPFLARRMDKHSTYRKINLVFAVLITLLLFMLAPLLVRLLYASDFAPSATLLRILAFSSIFLGISSAYGVNHLLLVGKEKLVRNISFIVTGFGVVFLTIMIKLFDELGAAFSMVIVNALYALSYYVAAQKTKREAAIAT